MIHEPETKPFEKMGMSRPAWRGACSCGWEGNGPLTEGKAMKSARQHVDDKVRAAVAEAEVTTDRSPAEVIEAVRALNADHYDLLAVAWERGTSALSIFGGEGGYAAVRYVLSADLSTVLVVERLSYGKRK